MFKSSHPKKALIISALIVILFACKRKDPGYTPDCSGPAKSFSTDVNLIIQSSCATDSDCHGAGSNEGVGELLTYSKISGVSKEIRSAVASGDMPKGGSLTNTQKNAILCWIDSGALNN